MMSLAARSQAMTAASRLQEQLSHSSTPYRDPLTAVAWDTADPAGLWLPEQALSLYGLPQFQALSQEARQTLSRYELIHLLQAGVWLEALFMERLSRSLHDAQRELSEHIYHLHEIREEAGHSLMFLTMMRHSHLALPPSPFPRLPLTNLVGRHIPFRHAGFWIAVLIGEAVPDAINRFVCRHRDAVCRVAYDIAKLHMTDEARHIAHARDSLGTCVSRLPRWQLALVSGLTGAVLREFAQALFFPRPALYELAGLCPGRLLAQAARANPARRRFAHDMLAPTLQALRRCGFALDWR